MVNDLEKNYQSTDNILCTRKERNYTVVRVQTGYNTFNEDLYDEENNLLYSETDINKIINIVYQKGNNIILAIHDESMNDIKYFHMKLIKDINKFIIVKNFKDELKAVYTEKEDCLVKLEDKESKISLYSMARNKVITPKGDTLNKKYDCYILADGCYRIIIKENGFVSNNIYCKKNKTFYKCNMHDSINFDSYKELKRELDYSLSLKKK